MGVAKTGMVGPETSLETLMDDLRGSGLLDAGPVVEYTLGIPSGVFLVARSTDTHVRDEFRYLKMGDGPDYLFYRPYVLCQFEAPLSAAEAVLYGTATITPRGAPVTDVVTYAKRDLEAGEPLEGIGGERHYGQIMAIDEVRRQDALPVGLAEYAALRTAVKKDGLVRYSDVALDEDALVVRSRRRQDTMFASAGGEA
jgi:predicted homoserine dehydrogenase-like protein